MPLVLMALVRESTSMNALGNIAGNISAATGLNVTDVGWGSINGTLTTDDGNLNAYAYDDITGVLSLSNGGTLSVRATYGQITANFSSGGDIGTLSAAKSISGTITANGNIGTITAGWVPGNWYAFGYPAASISGTITAGGDIGTLTATAGINATATAYGSILAITPGTGNLAGRFTAVHGSLPDINCTYGNITAILSAGTTIGNITAAGTISGNITAGGNIASITALLGNLAGTVRSTGGGIGNVFVGGTMSGSLFANAGSVGAMIVWDNITSGSTISAGAGELDVLCLGNVDGSITASTNVTLVASGTVSGDVTTSYGNVYIRSGGSILSSTISAGIDIALSARGDITSDLIFATNNVSLSAAGNISAPDVESTETGSVTEIAGKHLTTTASAPVSVLLAAGTICNCTVTVAGYTQSVGGGACFAAGTWVLLGGFTRRIEQLVKDDPILAVSENDPTGTPVLRRIVRVFKRPPTRIFEVEIAGHTLRTTAKHRFYVRHRGWVEAGDLIPGDQVQTPSKEYLKVTRAEQTNDFEPVYNFEVDRDHTYFVALGEGGKGVLVHNDGNCGSPATAPSTVYGPPLPPEMQKRLDQQAQQQKANEEFAKEMTDEFLKGYGTNPYIFVPYGPQQLTPAQQRQLQIQYDAWLKQAVSAIRNRYINDEPVPAGLVELLDGMIAHRVIGLAYDPSGGVSRAWLNRTINTILRDYKNDPNAKLPFLGNIRPDITNKLQLDVYEIKTVGTGANTAEREAMDYVLLLRLGGIPAHLGYSGDPTLTGTGMIAASDFRVKLIKWWSPRNGVILYQLTPLTPLTMPKFEFVPKLKPIPSRIDLVEQILEGIAQPAPFEISPILPFPGDAPGQTVVPPSTTGTSSVFKWPTFTLPSVPPIGRMWSSMSPGAKAATVFCLIIMGGGGVVLVVA